jgi:hypothetical protein
LASPSTDGGSAVAVSGLTSTSPASATDSSRAVVVAAGPVRMSSRWLSPTRNSGKSPVWMPIDMRSRAVPTEVRSFPVRVIRRCIWRAATTARTACLGPV